MIYFIASTSAILLYCIVTLVYYAINRNRLLVKERFNRFVAKPVVEVDYVEEITQERKRKKKTTAGLIKISKIQRELESAGVLLRDTEFVAIWFAVSFAPSGLLYVLGGKLIAVITLAIIGFCAPLFIVTRTKIKRLQMFEKQLGSSLLVIGNCLRAGFSFQQAMDSIAKEMPDPIGMEFRRSLREMQLGVAMEVSLTGMVARIGSRDLDLLMTSVIIQRQTGGNLIDIIESISETIKDRLRIKNEVRVLTATGRISGMVIGSLPIIVLAFFSLVNPTYVSQFFNNTLGIGMLVAAIILETVGFLIVRKIVDIKY